MRTLKEVRGMIKPGSSRWHEMSRQEHQDIEATLSGWAKVPKDKAKRPEEKLLRALGQKISSDAEFKNKFMEAMNKREKAGYDVSASKYTYLDALEILKPDKTFEERMEWALGKGRDEFLDALKNTTEQTVRPQTDREEGKRFAIGTSKDIKAIRDSYRKEVEDALIEYVVKGRLEGVLGDSPLILEIGASTGESISRAKEEILKILPKARFVHTDARKNPYFIYGDKEFMKHDIMNEQFELPETPDVIIFTNVMRHIHDKGKAWENMLTATGNEKPTLVLAGSGDWLVHRHLVAGEKVLPMRTEESEPLGIGEIVTLAKAAKKGLTPEMRQGQRNLDTGHLEKFYLDIEGLEKFLKKE